VDKSALAQELMLLNYMTLWNAEGNVNLVTQILACHSLASTPSTEAAPFFISSASFSTCLYME
jgi:hypothetical protein